jgi:hypothetical protein
MIKVTVPAMAIRNQKGVGKASGKPYDMDFQTVYFHTLDKQGNPLPFPEKAEIIIDKGGDGLPMPYAAGDYQLAPTSLYVDRGGNLAVAPRLIPLQKRG